MLGRSLETIYFEINQWKNIWRVNETWNMIFIYFRKKKIYDNVLREIIHWILEKKEVDMYDGIVT